MPSVAVRPRKSPQTALTNFFTFSLPGSRPLVQANRRLRNTALLLIAHEGLQPLPHSCSGFAQAPMPDIAQCWGGIANCFLKVRRSA